MVKPKIELKNEKLNLVKQTIKVRSKILILGEIMAHKSKNDAIWLAIHGKKIGKITPEEIEEESINEQKKLLR